MASDDKKIKTNPAPKNETEVMTRLVQIFRLNIY
jgi:hypothetical protein